MPSASADLEVFLLLKAFGKEISTLSASDLESPLTRQELLRISRQLTVALEPPEDVVIKQGYSLSLNMCIRVCIDLGIFTLLARSGRPMTSGKISESTKAEELLIVRLMRAVCGQNFATEVDANTYQANAVTSAIASPPLEAGFALSYDNASRPKSNLSEFLSYFRANGHKRPTSATDGPYQHANDCVGTTTFDHWMQHPAETLRFNTFMKAVRGSRPKWTDWFPVEQTLLAGCGADAILVVDVAGGHGHDLQEFASRFPNVEGRLVLQDLPSVIDEIVPDMLSTRIERQKHDFFTAQPIKGAKVYFMHMILHDWPDVDCVRILEHLRDAMESGYSRIFINDAILPDRNSPLIATAFDITMMAHHSGLERSEQMWRDLVAKVDGLSIVKFWQPPDGEGIVEIERLQENGGVL